MSDGSVAINALFSTWDGSSCNVQFSFAAQDGEVEVIVDDGQCIALDIRGVTPMMFEGITLDPNGSALASVVCTP